MRYLLVSMTLLAAALPVFAADEPAATSAPAPATASSQPAVDRSSPDKTWAAICDALKAGNVKGFRAGFYNRNELSQLFLDAYSDATVSSFNLGVAAIALGDDGKEFAKTMMTVYVDLVAMGKDHQTERTPELVRWTREQKTAKGNIQEMIYFKLFRGEWLVDTARTYSLDSDAGREGAEKLLDSLPKVTADIKIITADIHDGKITTIEQMKARLAKAK